MERIDDYSVLISGIIKRQHVYEGIVERFAEKFGKVHEVVFVREFD